MRVCECDPYNQCPDCDKRYLLMIDSIRGVEHYYCFDTYEALTSAFEEVENTNTFCGEEYVPHTAIKFLPISERKPPIGERR